MPITLGYNRSSKLRSLDQKTVLQLAKEVMGMITSDPLHKSAQGFILIADPADREALEEGIIHQWKLEASYGEFSLEGLAELAHLKQKASDYEDTVLEITREAVSEHIAALDGLVCNTAETLRDIIGNTPSAGDGSRTAVSQIVKELDFETDTIINKDAKIIASAVAELVYVGHNPTTYREASIALAQEEQKRLGLDQPLYKTLGRVAREQTHSYETSPLI